MYIHKVVTAHEHLGFTLHEKKNQYFIFKLVTKRILIPCHSVENVKRLRPSEKEKANRWLLKPFGNRKQHYNAKPNQMLPSRITMSATLQLLTSCEERAYRSICYVGLHVTVGLIISFSLTWGIWSMYMTPSFFLKMVSPFQSAFFFFFAFLLFIATFFNV